MAQRSEFIPVCRLQHALPHDHVTLWRAARRGKYGTVVHDERGRQAVSLAAVEAAEGVRFTDEQLALILTKPRRDPAYDRKVLERLRTLSPGPIKIEPWPQDFYTRSDAVAFALGCVQARDRTWVRYLNALRTQLK